MSTVFVEFFIFMSVIVTPVEPTLYSVTLMNFDGVLPNQVFSTISFSVRVLTLVAYREFRMDFAVERLPVDHTTADEPRITVATISIIPVTIELNPLRLEKCLILEFLFTFLLIEMDVSRLKMTSHTEIIDENIFLKI